jgi:hypothetical protein
MRFNTAKPQMSQVPWRWLKSVSRLWEVGGIKYLRGNWRTPASSVQEIINRVEDSFLRHITDVQDALEVYVWNGDKEQFLKHVTDPENGLDFFNHIIWNAIVLRYQLVQLGLLEEDPGQPWLKIEGWEDKVKEWEKKKNEALMKEVK